MLRKMEIVLLRGWGEPALQSLIRECSVCERPTAMQRWIGCLNSHEWCCRLQALSSCLLFFALFYPSLLCPFSFIAVKVPKHWRGWSFTPLLPMWRLIHCETHWDYVDNTENDTFLKLCNFYKNPHKTKVKLILLIIRLIIYTHYWVY